MKSDESVKRGSNGPLFFIGTGFAVALLVSVTDYYLVWWTGILLLSTGWLLAGKRVFAVTPAETGFLLFVATLFLNLLFAGSVDMEEGLFNISYALFGFLCITTLDREQLRSVCRVVVAVFICLSLWGIVQFTYGEGLLRDADYRAHTIFATPNSYAAAINLVLLPLLAVYMSGKSGKVVYFAIIILLAGLISTQSRGGWVAFLAGFIFLIILVTCSGRNHLFRPVAGLVTGMVFMIAILIAASSGPVLSNRDTVLSRVDQSVIYGDVASNLMHHAGLTSSGSHRMDMYRVALVNMKENPIFGVGYYNYFYYLHRDMGRYFHRISRYAHNDYLQIGLEAGIVGLLLLVLMIGLLFRQGIIALKKIPENEQIMLMGLLAGMAAYFTHAIVDFVMYVPVLMLMSGACIAMICRLTSGNCSMTFPHRGYAFNIGKLIRPRIIQFLFFLFVLSFTFQSVFAQICYNAANTEVVRNEHGLALNLFEIARRFSPGKVLYYQTEANYWRDVAITDYDRTAATRADKLYQEAASVNQFDPESRLERALLHRDWPDLLDNPADREEIIGWFETILAWRPHYNRVQAEYVRTLFQFGQSELASDKLKKYLSEYPGSSSLMAVYNELVVP